MKTKNNFLRYIDYLNWTYKAHFVANSSSCPTTELSKLLKGNYKGILVYLNGLCCKEKNTENYVQLS